MTDESPAMLDWAKLKPYEDDRRKSFEELCYQLAIRLHGENGRFTRIDDSGGGDGVEFYLTLPNRSEWGWQAKFFPNKRLTSSRKSQVSDSLNTSLDKHPKLTKWFLCTPSNFTKGEQTWFGEDLQGIAPGIELQHWGDSEINHFLARPEMAGIKVYFFGELEFSPQWFEAQVEKQIENASDKFIPELHTETSLDLRLHGLLGDDVFRSEIARHRTAIESKLKDAITDVDLGRNYIDSARWKQIRAAANEVEAAFRNLTTAAVQYEEVSSEGLLSRSDLVDVSGCLSSVQTALGAYDDSLRGLAEPATRDRSNGGTEDTSPKTLSDDAYNHLAAPLALARETYEAQLSICQLATDFRRRKLHLFGPAGIGKTHLACNLCQRRAAAGFGAVLLHGKHFKSTATIEEQIQNLLDIPSSYSWSELIEALESYAHATRSKVLIFIDALNEAWDIRTWKDHLPGFLKEITRSPHVVLVTTCRETYRPAIWDSGDDSDVIVGRDWNREDTTTLAEKYFRYFKLNASVTLSPLDQFRNPLYLRIFCEAQNGERLTEREVHVGEQTLFEVFDLFLQRTSHRICQRLDRVPNRHLAEAALLRLAELLWFENTRAIPRDVAIQLLDEANQRNMAWQHSLTKALLDEGLILTRDWFGQSESVAFTYDLLGGYLIARVLLKRLKDTDELHAFINSPELVEKLVSDNHQKRHPLAEDLLRCFSAVAPSIFGAHIYALTDEPALFSSGIRALFEMTPLSIGEAQVEEVHKLFRTARNRQPLLRMAQFTMTNTQHPLNMSLWDHLLRALPMTERDIAWTEFVRFDSERVFSEVQAFEQSCREPVSLSELAQKRLHLVALWASWLLTSTHRLLRDTATRALYWYGRRFHQELFDLTVRSLEINDPYVPERMLAASYGVAMALHADPQHREFAEKDLSHYAQSLYRNLFAAAAPRSTTHALMRDFARHTIELALLHSPALLNRLQRARITPPLPNRSGKRWGTFRPAKGDAGGLLAEPIRLDFGNYTIGHLICGRRNYDAENQEYRQVLAAIQWRIRDLGWRSEIFGDVDDRVGAWLPSRSEANEHRIDRYGKKYSWIAYYEMFGYRQDRGRLKDKWSDGLQRPTDVDIDPSFPGPPEEAQIVKEDLLGDRSTKVESWVRDGETPAVEPYLLLPEIQGHRGPWVLLEGYVHQEDRTVRRACRMLARSCLRAARGLAAFLGAWKNLSLEWPWMAPPEDYYTFAGETGWADTFPSSEPEDLKFVIGSRTRRVKESEYWARMEGRTEIEEDIVRKMRVFIPVRDNAWESYHSGVNPGRSVVVPSREICEALGLWMGLPSWNMYDRAGRRATTSISWRVGREERQTFTYIRKDLLDSYLRKRGMLLIWLLHGEREYCPSEEELKTTNWHESAPPNTRFQQTFVYHKGIVKLLE